MIKLHLKFTWPALILILIALAVWLARDPDQRQLAARRPPSPRPTPRTTRRDRAGSDDFDTETARLDAEAVGSTQTIFDEPIIEMPRASWRTKS